MKKVIFVKVERDGDASYMLACNKIEEQAEQDQKVLVGVYHLQEVLEVTTGINIKKVK